MAVITRLEVQKRSKERVNVYLDDEYAFSLNIMKAAALHKGQTLSEAEIALLRSEDDVKKAVDSAARFLAHRPRSVHEVWRNLAEKGLDEDVIAAAVERLEAMGYLDDHAFATFWIQNRQAFKPLSQRALRYELRQKGVSSEVIDAVLGELDEDDAAYRAAQTQLRRLRGLTLETFQARLNQFLQRRGFSHYKAHDAIQRIVEEIRDEKQDYFVDELRTDEE